MKSSNLASSNLKEAYDDMVKKHSDTISCRRDFNIKMIQEDEQYAISGGLFGKNNWDVGERVKIRCFQDDLKFKGPPQRSRDGASEESFDSIVHNFDHQYQHKTENNSM